MSKNNNGFIPGFKAKGEGGQDKQKLYHKPGGKKAKPAAQYEQSDPKNPQKKANAPAPILFPIQKSGKKNQQKNSSKQPVGITKKSKNANQAQQQNRQNTAKNQKNAELQQKQPQQGKQKNPPLDIIKQNNNGGQSSRPLKTTPLKIFSLGGLNEIGKNIYVYECANDIFIIDCGLAFPDEEMPGIDMVIPDFTYLERNKDRVRGIVLTHGHEDHIGSIPYLLKKVNVPVYGTRLTLGLVEGKLKEHGILGSAKLINVNPGETVKLGCMAAEFIRVNHSIPDACAVAVHTPAGVVIHTGDFKIDYTPIEGGIIDLARFGELGRKGVLALLSESTNAERPGYAMSERTVGNSFKNIFNQAEGRRIIVATFSSNIHRIQQIVDNAVLQGRKVAVSGRSMLNVMQKAIELNYIRIPDGILIDIDQIKKYPPEKLVIVTTGSQGEPLSALTRMAGNDHRQVQITPEDLIIISATPIPGNEKLVGNVVNDLMKLGADVVYEKMYDVHVSGHACQEELKMMISLTKPKFFVPIHGEYKHLKKHAMLAQKMGIPEENIFIVDIGQVLETNNLTMKRTGTVPSGAILVDGLGVGDVGSAVLRDRKLLAEDGLIIVAATVRKSDGAILSGPDIVTRGFVYVKESEAIIEKAKEVAEKALETQCTKSVREWGGMKPAIKDALSGYIYQRTKRSPMVIPIILEV